MLIPMAVYANGTTSGTTISNGADAGTGGTADQAGDVVINYISGIDPRNTTCPITTRVIDKVIGVALTHYTSASPSDSAAMVSPLSGTSGSTQCYGLKVFNTSNATENITFAATNTAGTAWSVDLLHDTNGDGAYDTGDTTLATTLSISADGAYNIIMRVVIALNASDGQNTTDHFTATSATAANFGEYTGANSVVYCRKGQGAESLANHYTTYTWVTSVNAPVITITKTIAITDSNDLQGGHLDLGASPGDTIEYTITYTNTGGADATNCIISDRVPTNTAFLADGYASGQGIQIKGVSKTNASGDDTAEYNSGLIVARIGSGATSTAGGSVTAPGTDAANSGGTVKFKVTIN